MKGFRDLPEMVFSSMATPAIRKSLTEGLAQIEGGIEEMAMDDAYRLDVGSVGEGPGA